MFRTSRFVTAGLATLAVAGTVSLAAPAQAADERGCGLPAVPAVVTTVVTDPVYRTVPAVTHTEWRWERDYDVYEFAFTRTTSPARVEKDWSRTVAGAPEFLFQRTVVDSPAVPAVPAVPEVSHQVTTVLTPAVTEVQFLFVHENTGKERWENENWGAQNGEGRGWKKTDQSRTVELEPAVTTVTTVIDSPAVPGIPAVAEVSHVESTWAAAAPGADWAGPLDERAGASTEEHTTTDGSQPLGQGWIAGATRSFDAVIDTVWGTLAPEGYEPTGEHRVSGTQHDETEATSAEAPFGLGWTKIEKTATTVTDTEETRELVTSGSTEQVEVSPAQPATAPCAETPATPEDEAAGPQAAPAPAADVAPAEATAAPAVVLPNTGGVPSWMAPAGLLSMVAGALLVRTARRRADLI